MAKTLEALHAVKGKKRQLTTFLTLSGLTFLIGVVFFRLSGKALRLLTEQQNVTDREADERTDASAISKAGHLHSCICKSSVDLISFFN